MYAGVPTVTPNCVSVRDSTRGGDERLADAEVRDERVPLVEQDVLGLDVAVHDVVAMRVVERVGHLLRDAERRRRPAAGARASSRLAQRLPSMTGIT